MLIKQSMGSSAMVCTLVAGVSLTGCGDSSQNGASDADAPMTGLNGKDGKDGVDGANGTNGRDGVDGKNGRDGLDAPPLKPVTIFAETPKKRSAARTAHFVFGCSEGNCTYTCKLDDDEAAECTSPVDLTRLGLGDHTFTVIASTDTDNGSGTSFDWTVRQPNILYIMADDLGYSDVEPFGGEIDTPNLRELAGSGHLLTNHHAGTVSAITRAMLISGTDHHLVGEGTMGAPNDERRGLPGYEGYLNDSALSVAELLRDGGYHTYIAGKWHIGSGISGVTTGGKTPDQWGFERSYVLIGGAASNHFAHEPAGSKNYAEDGQYVQPGQPGQPGGVGGDPEVFYSTDFYTQQLIKYIDSNKDDGKPFFVYAAYTSAHWPLAVPEPWLHMYRGRYDQGYDAIRNARIERLENFGITPYAMTPHITDPEVLMRSAATANNGTPQAKYISAVHSPADGYVDYGQNYVDKAWSSLSADEQKAQARYMEIYAGMITNLDHNIGLLISHLKEIGEYDDTFIMFQSDNGAEGWPIDSGADPTATDVANAQPGVFEALGTDNGLQNAKRLQYGLRWAEVSATPFAQTKGALGEGGVSVPAIVRLPGQTQVGEALHAFTHITDNTATFLDLAGVASPATPAGDGTGRVSYKDRAVYPVTGHSFLPALAGEADRVHTEPFGDESYGRAYVFSADGQWKARWTEPPLGPLDGHWELFDVTLDRGETNDVSAAHPDVVSDLLQQWNGYMTSVGGVEPLRPHGYY